jgi:hypothetical protein
MIAAYGDEGRGQRRNGLLDSTAGDGSAFRQYEVASVVEGTWANRLDQRFRPVVSTRRIQRLSNERRSFGRAAQERRARVIRYAEKRGHRRSS